ncbi:hypothetical protein [Actinoplanes couchii]|uniref:PknH-like extracellular domain-containing protein n=1 Tax=Actinoplanes couchii TaxID=403638 RepID=A0ABQ3X195_9ACTN|nr:hypothetical protein [Actinoplanes couchii]MDR6316697.1 hypothetical protein [Actinoplanes couchii]GID52306.1 hypothetical protein Aco03nite_007100 [Actinoplanes couchii]
MTRKHALALVLSAVLVIGSPAPALAGPGDPAGKLLTGTELPAGFTPQLDAIDDLFARIPSEIASCGQNNQLPAGTVFREFVRGAKDEELLVETLSTPGDQDARAAVAALRSTLPKCTSFTRAPGDLPMELKFAVAKFTGAPKLGDASAGIGFVMTVPEMELTVNGRLITVAARGNRVTLLLMTEKKPKIADLTAAARAAVTKVLSR